MGQVSLLALLRKMFSIFGRLQSIPYTNPEVTPANWCAIQPCKQVRIGTREIILISTLLDFPRLLLCAK